MKRSDRYSVGIGASKAGTCSSQASRSWELRGPETWGVRVGHALHVEARASSPGQDVRDSWTGAHHLRGEDALYAWSGAVSLPALGPRLDAHEVPPLAPASRAPAVQGRGLLHLPPALLPPPRGCKAGPLAYQDQVNRGLPEKVLSLADNPRNHTENQDERVLYGISHACLWHSNEDIPKRETYCPVIVDSLIQLCKSQILKHPSLARRICAQNNTLSTTWNRGWSSCIAESLCLFIVFLLLAPSPAYIPFPAAIPILTPILHGSVLITSSTTTSYVTSEKLLDFSVPPYPC